MKLTFHEEKSVDCLGLCESFVSDNVSDAFLEINGYRTEEKDHKGKSGGGFLIYISIRLTYRRRYDLRLVISKLSWLTFHCNILSPYCYCHHTAHHLPIFFG